MSKIYCQSCGKANTYNDSKPNFCFSCGFSFNKKITIAKKEEMEIEDDEEDEGESQDFSKISVSFDISTEKPKVSLGGIINTASKGDIMDDRIPPKNPAKNLKDLRKRVKEKGDIQI